MRQWIKSTCRFCNKDLGDSWIPKCDCEAWKAAEAERQAEWDELHKDDPPEEDFEKTYPLIYDRRIQFETHEPNEEGRTGDCIAVDARQYKDGVGLCIYIPFWDKETKDWDSSGLCFDFGREALASLRELLQEAEEAILKHEEKKDE